MALLDFQRSTQKVAGTCDKSIRAKAIASGRQIVDVGAAPHCPAGHFSPYSDGEKCPAAASALSCERW
ncbi:hypothetical protein [Mesorhizobium sp.]|uniref:hypothetical protein n=1 Tax=Mesorhizobium sp. TaxID=1871066 RepID=UPI0025D95576|nr:hypothetical protein [Mesorhizobium sp.]